MSVLPILRWPDERLAMVCAPVADPDRMRKLAGDMLDTMYDAPGRGLAAPQVGVLERMFVMDATWKHSAPSPLVCINPEIVNRSEDMKVGEEACLSIPGVSGQVERYSEITLRWQGLDGEWTERELKGFEAVCAQHELDHLDGIVIFDRLEEGARAQLEKEYEVLS